MFKDYRITVSGIFVRICPVAQIEITLMCHSEKRPAARYNRFGQDALYLTPTEESARVSLKKYACSLAEPLVLIKYQVQACELVDLRHPELKDLKQLSSGDWKKAFENGDEPESWQIADKLRSYNEIGLIDPSRKDPGIWHATLLRWNESGAPSVRIIGEPETVSLSES